MFGFLVLEAFEIATKAEVEDNRESSFMDAIASFSKGPLNKEDPVPSVTNRSFLRESATVNEA